MRLEFVVACLTVLTACNAERGPARRANACHASQSPDGSFSMTERLNPALLLGPIDLPQAALSNAGSVLVRFADAFAGDDAGARIAAAIADLPPGGGVVDARRLRGAQRISTTVTIAKPVTLLLPAAADAEFVSTPDPAFTVHDAAGVRILGGKLVLSGPKASAVTYTGITSNLLIERMQVSGSGDAADEQKGFYCYSGQTLSDIHIVHNAISDVTLGISFNADLGGTIAGALVQGNVLSRIVGMAPGQGYGIHHANGSGSPSDLSIVDNYVSLAQRHSIYQARGSGVLIANNLIVGHRQGVATGDERPAISVLRSTDVVVKGNVLVDPHDGAIDVSGDESIAASRITLENNLVRGWHGFPALSIGSAVPSRQGSPVDVVVRGNRLTSGASEAFGPPVVAVLVRNGKRLLISHNEIRMPDAAIDPIVVERDGDSPGSALYTDDVELVENCILIDPAEPCAG